MLLSSTLMMAMPGRLSSPTRKELGVLKLS
jgi:hypothetical protein